MRDEGEGGARPGEPLEQALARQGLSAEDHLGSALRARWVLDSMAGVVALLAPDGSTVELNQAGIELAGVRRPAAVGQPFWGLPAWAPDGSAGPLLRSAVADASAGTAARVEVSLAEGGVMLLELRPLASSTGAVRLVVVEGRDVSDLHALAERLRAVDTRRRRFVQAVGHDLKSPLAVLLALTDRAQARGAGAELDGIAAAARALGDQVDDLLSAARESDAAFEPSLDHQDLAHIVREAVQGLNALAFARGVRVDVVAPAALVVRADRRRIASAVVNLVNNALRYARTTIEVRLEAAGSFARLTVCDDGPGVPVRMRDEVFDRFRQGGDPNAAGAVGLGLAIVRDVVTLHGGSVRLDAGDRGGARFTVDLPRVRSTAEPAELVPDAGDAFDLAPVGIGIVGAGGRWGRVNAALCALLGHDESELLDHPASELLPPVVRGPVGRALASPTERFEVEQRPPGAARDRRVLWTGASSDVSKGRVVVLCAQELSPLTARRPAVGAHGGGPQTSGPPTSRPRQGGLRRADGSGVTRQRATGPR